MTTRAQSKDTKRMLPRVTIIVKPGPLHNAIQGFLSAQLLWHMSNVTMLYKIIRHYQDRFYFEFYLSKFCYILGVLFLFSYLFNQSINQFYILLQIVSSVAVHLCWRPLLCLLEASSKRIQINTLNDYYIVLKRLDYQLSISVSDI